MKEVYQSPESDRAALTTGPEIDSACVSNKELPEAMKADGCSENRVCYRANPNFVTREIAGELLLVPVGEQTQKLNGMVTFSEAGAFLWKQLQQRCTKADLVMCLAKEYDQHPDDVRADVDSFIDNAVARELVIKC